MAVRVKEVFHKVHSSGCSGGAAQWPAVESFVKGMLPLEVQPGGGLHGGAVLWGVLGVESRAWQAGGCSTGLRSLPKSTQILQL